MHKPPGICCEVSSIPLNDPLNERTTQTPPELADFLSRVYFLFSEKDGMVPDILQECGEVMQ